MNIERVINYCNTYNIKYVLFDFFGTLLTRNCLPNEIKHSWAKEMSVIFKHKIDEELLFHLRIQAEQAVAKRAKKGEFNYLELTNEIYRRLEQLEHVYVMNDTLNNEVFYELSYQTECRCELNSHRAIEETSALIDKLYQMGIKMVVVSDFYLSSDTLKEFIIQIGLRDKIEEVFVSCDERCSKHTGDLYKIVLERLQVSPEQCIMIGDNENVDIKNAKQHGISGFMVNSSDENQFEKIENIITELAKECRKGKLAYSNYCFLLYLYVERLVKELMKDEITDVYFLAREGEFLKRLFDAYISTMKGVNINSHYLYVSRKATYPATLDELDKETFGVLRSTINNSSLDTFLENIGMFECKNVLAEQFNIEDAIQNFFDSPEFEEIKKNPIFRKLYEEKRMENKGLLKEYFLSEGMGDVEKIAIVDVGWNGTMQNHIYTIMDKKICKGYYIGVLNEAYSSVCNLKRGIIFSDNPLPSKDKELWGYDHVFLERILWASHESTGCYKKIDGKVVPQFENFMSEKGNYSHIKPVQDLIYEKFMVLDRNIKESPFYLEQFYEKILHTHLDMIFRLNKEQLNLQRKMFKGQMQNFGQLRSANDSFNSVFGIKQIVKKGIKKIRLLKNTELVFRVLLNYKFDRMIQIIYYFKRKSISR